MRINNKGITLVEIIISVSLISIVLVFLFNMLIQVNNENSDNEIKSSYLVNQSTFTKQIQEDFLDFHLEEIGGTLCNLVTSGTTSESQLSLPKLETTEHFKCIKFDFDNTIYSYAYLFIYERTDKKTILSYYRGDFKQSAELEEFIWEDNLSPICKKCDPNEYLKNKGNEKNKND